MNDKYKAFDNLNLYNQSILNNGIQRHYLYESNLYKDKEFVNMIETMDLGIHKNGIKNVNFIDFLSSITPKDATLNISFIANGAYGYAFKCTLGSRVFVIKFSMFYRFG